MKILKAVSLLAALALAGPLQAADTEGVVVAVEGRADNSCRYVFIKKGDGSTIALRIVSGAGSEGIFSAAVTALAAKLPVYVSYSPNSVCDSGDQGIGIFRILAP